MARDIPCRTCGSLIERWGARWRHVNRVRFGPSHSALPPLSEES